MQAPPPTVDAELRKLFFRPFAREFRRSVKAYMKRWRMASSTYGRKVFNDPGFVKRALVKRRRVRLGSADKARTFMGLVPFGRVLAHEVRAFLRIAGVKPWLVGDLALHRAGFIQRLFDGASPYLTTIDRLRAWMHGQLRPEQLEALLIAVARGLSEDEEVDGCFFPNRIRAAKRRGVNERWSEAAEYARGRRTAWTEPAHAGALPGHGRGSPLPQGRALGEIHARRPRRLARGVRPQQHLGPGSLRGRTRWGVRAA